MAFKINIENIFESIDSAAILLDENLLLLDQNEAFLHATGYDPRLIESKPLVSFFEPGHTPFGPPGPADPVVIFQGSLRARLGPSQPAEVELHPVFNNGQERPAYFALIKTLGRSSEPRDDFSTSLFRAITEGISDAFVALDKNWIYIYVNNRAGQLFDRNPSDLIGKHIWTEFPEGVGQPFHRAYMKAMLEQQFVQIEEYYPPWDRWFENRIFPFQGGLLIFFQDISGRKRVELELMRVNNLLSESVKLGRMGTWEWNLISNSFWWSDSLFEITGQEKAGYSPSLESFEMLLLEEDRENLRTGIKDCLETSGPIRMDFRLRTSGERLMYYNSVAHLYFDSLGRKEKVIGVVMDATEFENARQKLISFNKELEKKVQERTHDLQESRSNLTALIENTSDGIWSVDTEKRLITFNEAFEKSYELLIGKRLKLGSKLSEILDPDEFKSYYQFWNKLIDKALSGKRFMQEYEIEIRDKKIVYLISCSPVIDNDQIQGATFFSKDITERKNSELQILKLNKELETKIRELEQINEDLKTFTYSVSHDLRAPIRVISGFAELLKRKLNDSLTDDVSELMNGISTNAIRMNKLIDDLLQFSKIGRKEVDKTLVNMNELVEAIVRDFTANQKDGAAVEFKKDDLPSCNADYALMTQVLINLISNAVKYSSKKPLPRVEIGGFIKGRDIVYFVKDNGAGFDMKHAGRLFQVFQRLHGVSEFEGTGVGLAIVHKIISKHHGKVWAEGEPGEGATFYFSLPQEL